MIRKDFLFIFCIWERIRVEVIWNDSVSVVGVVFFFGDF